MGGAGIVRLRVEGQEFALEHVKFKMPVRSPSGDTEWFWEGRAYERYRLGSCWHIDVIAGHETDGVTTGN